MGEHFDYFTSIEDAFVRMRGQHILLSPGDWALIESWHKRGIPAEVVIEGIEAAFNTIKAKSLTKPIRSLAYCSEYVERLVDEQTGQT